ncbi:MAG: hypothetical protein WC307_00960 [Candidatus Nanoarchaeia archaeon]|jgi:hypothetical protein
MIFPISKSCYKIVNHVYNNNGTKISKLLREASVSQRIGYQHIDELIKLGIFKEECNGSLRIIKPDFSKETGRLLFGLIEKEKELNLIEKKPTIKDSLINLTSESSNLGIKTALLFGPFIKDHGKEKIDILVISEGDSKRILLFLQDCFSNIENAVSARIVSLDGFTKLKNNKNDLFQAFFKNHICVYNTQSFLKIID